MPASGASLVLPLAAADDPVQVFVGKLVTFFLCRREYLLGGHVPSVSCHAALLSFVPHLIRERSSFRPSGSSLAPKSVLDSAPTTFNSCLTIIPEHNTGIESATGIPCTYLRLPYSETSAARFPSESRPAPWAAGSRTIEAHPPTVTPARRAGFDSQFAAAPTQTACSRVG